jgi:hypothetical protein
VKTDLIWEALETIATLSDFTVLTDVAEQRHSPTNTGYGSNFKDSLNINEEDMEQTFN